MKRAYLSFVRLITILENAVSTFGLVFATFFTVFQILNRYWLHLEIIWIADLTLYVFVFSSFFSTAIATREDAHTCVDVFVGLLCKGERAKEWSRIIISFLCIVILCALTPAFYAYFLRAIKFAEWGTLVRWFNTSWITEAFFVMFILNIFHIAQNTAMRVINLYGAAGGGVAE
ncbi:MAG: TRAP transporter small permease subunit [Synergistaceae bacterium]|nr:TRAP transporter small permease subunit [Synergistaceae bacterium]